MKIYLEKITTESRCVHISFAIAITVPKIAASVKSKIEYICKGALSSILIGLLLLICELCEHML